MLDSTELQQFYRGQVNDVRGDDTVLLLSRKLQQSYKLIPYRSFLMGHSGVGQSTEISRLLERVKDQQIGVRLSIAKELNPASFKVFDVVMLMMIRLAEAAQVRGILPDLSDLSIAKIERLFDSKQIKTIDTRTSALSAEAGGGIKEGSGWANLFGLFVSAKAEMKFAEARYTKTTEYRLNCLQDLVDACNLLIDHCDARLEQEGNLGPDCGRSG